MSNLLERLRDKPTLHEESNGLNSTEMMVWHGTALEAADEIERQADRIAELEAVLDKLDLLACKADNANMVWLIRAATEQGDSDE